MGLKDLGYQLAASGVAAALDELAAGPRMGRQRASAA
jgi:hypothetical protein